MKIIKYIFLAAWSLVAIEFFFRIFNPVPMIPRYIMATDYGIRGNKVNSEYTHKSPEYKVHFKINSKGVRSNEEIPYEKDDSVQRILLLGDSFGMGYGAKLEETFIYQAKDILKDQGINTEVIILAVSGHGNSEELIHLQNEGYKYSPDLVIVQFHRTDFNDNIRSGLYKIENDIIVRKNKEYLPAVEIREKLFSYAIYRWLAGNCHFYNWFREFIAIKAKRILANKGKAEEQIINAPKPEITNKDSNSFTNEEELTYKLLLEIEDFCDTINSSFLVFEVPSRVTRTEFKRPVTDYFANIIDSAFSVATPIQKFYKKGNGEKLYWERSDGHFTPLGCRLAAESIVDKIFEDSLLTLNNQTELRQADSIVVN